MCTGAEPLVAADIFGSAGAADAVGATVGSDIAASVGMTSVAGPVVNGIGTAASAGSILGGPVTSSILTGAGSAAASTLLGRRVPGVPSAPIIPAVTPMPLPDDAAVAAARRRSIASQLDRQGRAGTILDSSGSQTLGN